MRQALVLAALLLVAGCAGFGPPEKPPLTPTADEVAVADDALAAAGFERASAGQRTLNVSVYASVTGDVKLSTTREVSATIHAVELRGDAAVVTVASVPSVTLLNGQVTRNPASALSPAALASRLQSRYGNVSALSKAGTRPASMLGNDTTLTTYRGTAVRDGSRVDVTVQVATVRDGDDYVTLVAVYPRDADATDRVLRLARGVTR